MTVYNEHSIVSTYRSTERHADSASALETAAIAYARRGVPVFPLRSHSKEPFGGTRGFYDATTDEEQIRKRWRKWPEANIGIPTGEGTGLLVIDVESHGFGSLAKLEEKHGKLPHTARTKTGRGGMHILLRYPAGERIKNNNSGKLGVGIDVRATGGYIVVPPSRTEGSYEWLVKAPLAEPPEWLLQLLREPQRASQDTVATDTRDTTGTAPVVYPAEHIPMGERNVQLTSIAGKLRARGYEYEELLTELERINTTRCSQGLPANEVEKIARSIFRYRPGNAAPEVTPEIIALCRRVEETHLWGRRWAGLGGKSQRALLLTVLRHAVLYGERIPGGIRVSLSQRAASEDACISRKAVRNAILKLKLARILRIDPAKKQGECAAFVLIPPPAQGVTTQPPSFSLKCKGEDNGYPLRAPYSAARLRHAAPGVWRLGKGCEEFVDALELVGGSATVQEIAAMIHHPRPRDLRRRVGKRLEEEAVVEWSGDNVSFAPAWRESWHRARVEGGEIEAAERYRARHLRERESFRNRGSVFPEKAPTHDELRECRERYPERRRRAIQEALVRLFLERPEYRVCRTGQITCALLWYLPSDFPRGQVGVPKDSEVAAVLDGYCNERSRVA